MITLYPLIDKLVDWGITSGLIADMDRIYVRNRLLAAFKEESYELEEASSKGEETLCELLDQLTDKAITRG